MYTAATIYLSYDGIHNEPFSVVQRFRDGSYYVQALNAKDDYGYFLHLVSRHCGVIECEKTHEIINVYLV